MDDAVGQVFGVMVAGIILMASVGAILWTVSTEPVDPHPTHAAARHAEAQSLVSILVREGTGWERDPDQVAARLGLLGDHGLDLDKLELLRSAALESTPNGRLDYADALMSLLGPDAGLDFHLRVYPTGLGPTADDLSAIRTAYIGDWSGLGSYTVKHDKEHVMVADANTAFNATVNLGTSVEREMLTRLGLAFTDHVHITSSQPRVLVEVRPRVEVPLVNLLAKNLLEGDVYPDHKPYLHRVLPERLDEYRLVVIGSGVDQSALTSYAVKNAIRDWVMDGGTLVVLGTDKQDYQWLRPIFDGGVSTANGAPHSPDSAHPLLRVPHQLDWPYYDHHGRAWDIGEDLFEPVVLSGDDAVLAVSKEGSFGSGRVFLTTYQPRGIAGSLGFDEGSSFLHNIIVYMDREHLFLDYGPPVPDHVVVASAAAQTWVIDDIGLVPMRVEVLVWER